MQHKSNEAKTNGDPLQQTHRLERRCPHLGDLGHFADFPYPPELEHIHRFQTFVQPDAAKHRTNRTQQHDPPQQAQHKR